MLVAGLCGSAGYHPAALRHLHAARVDNFSLHQHPSSHLHHMAGNQLLLCCCEFGSSLKKKSNLEMRKIVADFFVKGFFFFFVQVSSAAWS